MKTLKHFVLSSSRVMQAYNLRKRKFAIPAKGLAEPSVPSKPKGKPPAKSTAPSGEDVGLKVDLSQFVLGASSPSPVRPPPASIPAHASVSTKQDRGFTQEKLEAACLHLSAVDQKLVPYIQHHGPPERLLAKLSCCCFASLAKSIVFQQLATGAAAAIYARVLRGCKCEEQLSAGAVLAADVQELRGAGLSERKVSYLRDLSRHFQEGHLSDDLIASWDDATLHRELTRVKGIGDWTCDMFAMFHLGHPDILPTGDLGVRRGMQVLYNLQALPDAATMERVAERWRPFRSAGCYYMWRVDVPRRKGQAGAKAGAKTTRGKRHSRRSRQ